MPTSTIIFLLILIATMLGAYRARKLTLIGMLTGGLVAICIFLGGYFTGVGMLATFFVLAVLATSWKKRAKSSLSATGEHAQMRDARQVLANGSTTAICGLLGFYHILDIRLSMLLMAAALASATADTLSSELGIVYGKRFYNIISFKPDEKGRDGVISLEGTLIGVIGAAAIAVVYSTGQGWQHSYFLCIVASGAIGNFADSVLGATLERRGYLKNNAVNLLNTAIAALTAYLIMTI